MPLIVWSYPRGSAIDAKGGKDSFYAVDYAARTASELGADVVKVNFPHPEKRFDVPEPYRPSFSSQQAIEAVVRSANRTLLLVSGGERAGDEAMLEKARQSMEAGATGLIFGRNVWQREHDRVPPVCGRAQGDPGQASVGVTSADTGHLAHRPAEPGRVGPLLLLDREGHLGQRLLPGAESTGPGPPGAGTGWPASRPPGSAGPRQRPRAGRPRERGAVRLPGPGQDRPVPGRRRPGWRIRPAAG